MLQCPGKRGWLQRWCRGGGQADEQRNMRASPLPTRIYFVQINMKTRSTIDFPFISSDLLSVGLQTQDTLR
jgi:hypothetical protein